MINSSGRSLQTGIRFRLLVCKDRKREVIISVTAFSENQHQRSTELNVVFRSRKTAIVDLGEVCLCANIGHRRKVWSMQPRSDREPLWFSQVQVHRWRITLANSWDATFTIQIPPLTIYRAVASWFVINRYHFAFWSSKHVPPVPISLASVPLSDFWKVW